MSIMKLMIVLYVLGIVFLARAHADVKVPRKFEVEFRTAAANSGVPEQLLRAVCYVESGLNPKKARRADGRDGKPSIGLCGLKMATAEDMGFKGHMKDLFKPEINVTYAAEYLAFQMSRYKGDVGKALTAYNRGNFSGNALDKANQYVALVLLAYYERR